MFAILGTLAPSMLPIAPWLRSAYLGIGSLGIAAAINNDRFPARAFALSAGILFTLISTAEFVWSSNLRDSVFHLLIGGVGLTIGLVEKAREKLLLSLLPETTSDELVMSESLYLESRLQTKEIRVSSGLLLILLVEAFAVALMVLRFVITHK